MGTCRNKTNKAYSFFVLLTFVSKNRKGEISKKEKSLSITDLYFPIWSNPVPPFPIIAVKEGAWLGVAERKFFLFAPFSIKKKLSIQSNIDWVPEHSEILASPSYIKQLPPLSNPKLLIEFPIRLYNLIQDPVIRHSLSNRRESWSLDSPSTSGYQQIQIFPWILDANEDSQSFLLENL